MAQGRVPFDQVQRCEVKRAVGGCVSRCQDPILILQNALFILISSRLVGNDIAVADDTRRHHIKRPEDSFFEEIPENWPVTLPIIMPNNTYPSLLYSQRAPGANSVGPWAPWAGAVQRFHCCGRSHAIFPGPFHSKFPGGEKPGHNCHHHRQLRVAE